MKSQRSSHDSYMHTQRGGERNIHTCVHTHTHPKTIKVYNWGAKKKNAVAKHMDKLI